MDCSIEVVDFTFLILKIVKYQPENDKDFEIVNRYQSHFLDVTRLDSLLICEADTFGYLFLSASSSTIEQLHCRVIQFVI